MSTFIWACIIASFVLIIRAAPSADRKRTASWFDLLPHMTASKKLSGRVQQKKRKARR